MDKINALQHKLTRARAQLLLNQPFFGTLCLRLKLVGGSVPAMATDGRKILYDPSFVESLLPEELEAVLAHEVMHCALGHHCRRAKRDPRLWNRAADLAINPLLVANGFKLPDGALLDPAFENLSAEEIYAQLEKRGCAGQPDRSPGSAGQSAADENQPRDSRNGTAGDRHGQGAGSGQPGQEQPEAARFGEVIDAVDEEGAPASEAERSRQQTEWRIAADQAIRSAIACGREPAQINRPLSEVRRSTQDWRSILRQFVLSQMPADYRWSPPNRRYISAGLYLPSVERAGLGPVVIALDTSGSIGLAMLEQFAGEISAICDETRPERIHVVYCDAAVQEVQEFAPAEAIELQPKGGGGTDFRPPFEWAEQNGIEPACMIYLTDLLCHCFPDRPEYPVLWVTDSRRQAPWGETIQITGSMD